MKRLSSEHPAVKAVTDAVQRLERAEAENASASKIEILRVLVINAARSQNKEVTAAPEKSTLTKRVKFVVFWSTLISFTVLFLIVVPAMFIDIYSKSPQLALLPAGIALFLAVLYLFSWSAQDT